MNSEAGSAKNSAAFATSAGRQSRPRGMDDMNRARFAGLSSPPMKVVSSGVSAIAGLMLLARMLSGASSTASDLVRSVTAPLVPLYHDRPGRGRTAAVEPMLMKQPDLCRRKTGTQWIAER